MNTELALLVAAAAVVVALCAGVTVSVGIWLGIRYLEHRWRIERREAGLPEVPREQKPEPKWEKLPAGLWDLIVPFESMETRRHLEGECRALRANGVPWAEIERTLKKQLVD